MRKDLLICVNLHSRKDVAAPLDKTDAVWPACPTSPMSVHTKREKKRRRGGEKMTRREEKKCT
jgi:hypothetical protein